MQYKYPHKQLSLTANSKSHIVMAKIYINLGNGHRQTLAMNKSLNKIQNSAVHMKI